MTQEPSKITRVEVIDYTKDVMEEGGRVYTERFDTPVKVETLLQDDDRTLKIFILK